jgi:SNF2 family DNA or RNA helicase
MSFFTNIDIAIYKHKALYNACDPAQQIILRILAVVNHRFGQSKFKQVLQELSHADVFNRLKLQSIFTVEVRDALVVQGLITINQDGIKLSPYLADELTRLSLEEESFEGIVDVVERIHPMMSAYSWGRPSFANTQRIIRDSFYRGQYQICVELFEFNKDPQKVDAKINETLIELCFYPFNEQQFLKLPYQMQYQAFASLLYQLRKDMIDRSEVVALLAQIFEKTTEKNDELRHLLTEQYIYQCRFNDAKSMLLDKEKTSYGLQLAATLSFLQGDLTHAVESFKSATVAKNKISRRKHQYVGDLHGLFYAMALLAQGSDEMPQQLNVLFTELANQLDERRYESTYQQTYICINRFNMLLAGRVKSLELSDPYSHVNNYAYHVYVVVSCLCLAWSNQTPSLMFLRQLSESCQHLNDIGEFLWSKVSIDLLNKYQKILPINIDVTQQTFIDITALISRKETWALALEQLIALDKTAQSTDDTDKKTSRLVWLLQHSRFGDELSAKEQKLGKSGWSKGRVVSLKRLSQEMETFDYLSNGDIALCAQIKAHFNGGYYGKENYSLTGYLALKYAVGLPNIYLEDNPHQDIVISEREPELVITQNDDGFLLSMSNVPSDIDDTDSSYSLTNISDNQFELVAYEKKHRQIASIVGESGLTVPKEAKDKVIQSISVIAPLLNIQSNLEGITSSVEKVGADSRLYINIEPAGDGLEYKCHVMPLGSDGPSISPGMGNPTLSQDIGGKRQSVTRDLLAERRQLQRLVDQVPLFEQMIDSRLLCDRLDEALETLMSLENVVANPNAKAPLDIALQWPKGKSLKLSAPQEMAHMKLAVTKQKEWFDLEGTLTVSDDQVIELKTLMALMAQSQSRFIKLDEQQILVLTKELKQRLQDIENMTLDGKFHALASPLIDVATQGMRMRTLHAWDRQKALLKEASELVPQQPSTLQAELRDYQHDGFDWAMRLAHWGAGACLADDMGLGKTLQALAVIIARAKEGASLVLAPTSVCFNWQQEIARFAPTLNVKIFGRDGDIRERQNVLDNLKPFDLVICSYGLLQRESEKLAAIDWQTIVADEAQALKNPLAKRTQAALALKAQFKMITTGTPIENNLTELWSLFRFINPGLLGSQKQFHKRFAQLIESNKASDDSAKRRASFALRQVISPFILRRLKSQVLTELPARTEINLPIELSTQEITFYEALRRQAVENLMQEDVEPGQQHIRMLAEIMKLRRACCHPSLVMPESTIEGSKLKAFDNLMVELKQNNHKCLVFSQFVGHLHLLRERLIANGISFQYLDGSTPIAQRQQAVNAFQAGEGDVFLISLKAGGSGLNLTAADYVVHMDPWWNPAVEDQASDRAHRMGQTRPVTIYRFIAKNTIEDKIVALHQHKRDLANSLLEGSDNLSRLSPDDMMALLQESWTK